MLSHIQISTINDYLFCPRSLFFHSVYYAMNTRVYHSHYQVGGNIAHKQVDSGQYSSSKRYISGMSITSEKYEITGKIDIYDREKKALIERKKKIKIIFPRHLTQLYAQMLCMEEMGYSIEKMFIHSLDDNKRTEIALPDDEKLTKFFKVLKEMRIQDFDYFPKEENILKCKNCIYHELCRGDI
jgi:CRISPR-associated exonuclease Cas4